jgi:hypothetical protein
LDDRFIYSAKITTKSGRFSFPGIPWDTALKLQVSATKSKTRVRFITVNPDGVPARRGRDCAWLENIVVNFGGNPTSEDQDAAGYFIE